MWGPQKIFGMMLEDPGITTTAAETDSITTVNYMASKSHPAARMVETLLD